MNLTTNTKVKTPLGEGMIQGAFAIQDTHGGKVVQGALVRLPVNDTTRPHLNKSNCVTPRASSSGVWVFKEGELSL